jgi:hypothetical protein
MRKEFQEGYFLKRGQSLPPFKKRLVREKKAPHGQ